MKNITTEIKNIMTSHLRGKMFGMEIYGQHKIPCLDSGAQIIVIEVGRATRFERYGSVVVYHPTHGKWQAALLSEYHTGKPVQVLTAEQIREYIAETPSQDFVYEVYGGEKPNVLPVSWE